MRIDVHAHYWTNDYLDMLVELGKTDTDTQRGMGAGGGDDLVARLGLMDRAGVELQVLSAAPQLPCGDDRDLCELAQTQRLRQTSDFFVIAYTNGWTKVDEIQNPDASEVGWPTIAANRRQGTGDDLAWDAVVGGQRVVQYAHVQLPWRRSINRGTLRMCQAAMTPTTQPLKPTSPYRRDQVR
jgi:hypothetical protein